MEDRYVKEKLARDKFENQFMDVFFLKDMAQTIIDDLVKWSNDEIYSRLGGKLECELVLSEAVNARASVDPDDPYNPRIEIYMGMVREVYRDSFVFPMLADRISSIPGHDESFKDKFGGAPSYFEGGVPDIPDALLTPLYKIYKSALEGKDQDARMTDKSIACRFLMFEVMLVWVFFHEVSHLAQRHYLFRNDKVTAEKLEEESYEISETECAGDECVRFQAREVLADVEGSELTIRYLLRKKMFHFSAIYLLYCAQYCMFNRFYMGYEPNLDFVNKKHPHPVVRNELTSSFLTEYVIYCLANMEGDVPVEKILMAVVYLSVKSSLISGIYWGNRYEAMSGELTPFMRLMMDEVKREEYCSALMNSVHEHLPVIKGHHLNRHNFTDFIGVLRFFSTDNEEDQQG